MSHSSLPVALLASHPPCGSLWAAPKAPLGPRFPSGQFAALTRREKALHCPFCRQGSQRRARHSWRIISFVCARSCARLFPPSKWTGLFPSAAYRRSAPPQVAWGKLKWRCLGCCSVAGRLRSAKKRASFFLYNWHCTYSTNGAGMIRCCLDIFATQKASVISYPRWPFMRAMRPVAEWRSFLFNWRFTTPDR